jgi:hypothetical protein
VPTALIKGNTTYVVRLKSQRTGNVVWEKSLNFSGDAPWKLFLPVACPDAH